MVTAGLPTGSSVSSVVNSGTFLSVVSAFGFVVFYPPRSSERASICIL